MPPVVITSDRRDNGQTLAAVLKAHLGLTWSQAKRVIDRRHVRVGGQIVADIAFRVKSGKRITVAEGVLAIQNAQAAKKPAPSKAEVKPKKSESPKKKPPTEPKRQEPAFECDILFSDDHVVVVNKPAGLTTMRHAEEAEEFGRGKRFLTKTLADHLPVLLGRPDRRVIAVHRLDRDTSGVIVFARTPAVAKDLMTQFKKHTTDRRYSALVRGEPKPGRIQSTFVPDRGDGRRGSGEGEDGKKAVTYVKVLEHLGAFSRVECRLETGRTHQVRIHLGEAGTPLCGEHVYDRPPNGQPLPDGSGAARPMLHALSLGFTHPVTGELLSYEVPPPADFAKLLEKLRGEQ
ncbi:RluA family pseudouridine synthase [Limnoglobus roseus]|nr:RluA family pseudouridine synthase [Limnoglobus roseus]